MAQISLGDHLEGYKELLKEIASLSALFSDNEDPYFFYRAVEAAYVWSTGSTDLARSDKAFDAIHPDGYGVGIKTFTVKPSDAHKFEKVAEFNALSNAGEFEIRSKLELAKRIALARNQRIEQAYNLEIVGHAEWVPKLKSSAIYHCVIRTRGRFFIQEYEYPFIDVDAIQVLSGPGESLLFTDGSHTYRWNSSKSTLYMKFELEKPPNERKQRVTFPDREVLFKHILNAPGLSIPKSFEPPVGRDKVPGDDYWVLPLFTPSKDGISPRIGSASGINLCFASQKGRKRKMGESEIAISTRLRNKFPDFLPFSGKGETQSAHFLLPNGESVFGKRTGTDGKNLTFSDKKTGNHNQRVFTDWIYFEIDKKSKDLVQKRWKNKKPYTYEDLVKAGVDSLVIEKTDSNTFGLRLGELGTYDSFIEFVGLV